MGLGDIIRLIHPALAVIIVFPLIGIVVHRAWLTRSRRLAMAAGGTSKIPPIVGTEHVQIGRWLTGMVVGLTLIGLGHPIFKTILQDQVWRTSSLKVALICLLFIATPIALACLFKAKTRRWRILFTVLSCVGLIILGAQDGVYRREFEWYVSHFFYGMGAALLMIVSLAIVPEIFRDRTQAWRRIHIGLNCIALLLYLGQGMTGVRDLLEIPLGWQEPYLYECDYDAKICPQLPAIGIKNSPVLSVADR